jgi:hypothetical protein
MRDGSRPLKTPQHKPIELKRSLADLGNHINSGCSRNERSHASSESLLHWSSARLTPRALVHSSKGDEKNGESGKDIGHPTTDSALTIPHIAERGAFDLKDWLKWKLGERASLAWRNQKRHSLAVRVCVALESISETGRVSSAGSIIPTRAEPSLKSATVASRASSVPGQPCKTTAYRHVILGVQAR